MHKPTKNDMATAALVGVGLAMMISFANFTTENSKPKRTAQQEAAYIDMKELQAEESREAEKAAEIEATTPGMAYGAAPTVYEVIITTAEPTTPQQTTQEPTETPTTTTEAETLVETQTAATEPETAPETAPSTIPETAPTTTQATAPQAYTDDEVILLRIAGCEGYTQGPEGMALIMRVIINRMKASGANALAVVTAPGQFAAVNTPLYQSGFIHPDAYAALEMIRNGWDGSQGALYFCAPNPNGWHRRSLQYLFTYGGHEFFK